MSKTKECPACNGFGVPAAWLDHVFYEEPACPSCDGRGYVKDDEYEN